MCARFVSRGAPFHAFHNCFTHNKRSSCSGVCFSPSVVWPFFLCVFFFRRRRPFFPPPSSSFAKKKQKKTQQKRKKSSFDFRL